MPVGADEAPICRLSSRMTAGFLYIVKLLLLRFASEKASTVASPGQLAKVELIQGEMPGPPSRGWTPIVFWPSSLVIVLASTTSDVARAFCAEIRAVTATSARVTLPREFLHSARVFF